MSPQLLYTALVGLSVFAVVICIWMMVVLVWASNKDRRTKVLGHRLGISGDGTEGGRTLSLWLDGKEIETAVSRGQNAGMMDRFTAQCQDAGWEAPPATI